MRKNEKLNSYRLLDFDLQMFAGGKDDVSDNQADVVGLLFESDDDSSDGFLDYDDGGDDSTLDDDEDEQAQKPDAADPDKPGQTPEENEVYKKMRQKAKDDVLKELETDRVRVAQDKKEIEEFRAQQRNAQIEQKHFAQITQEAVEELAYKEGISEDFAHKHLVETAKNQAIQEINNISARVNQAQLQKAALRSEPFFAELEKEVDEMVTRDPSIDITTAYTYLRGKNLPQLLADTKSNAEKRTLANVQDNARRRSVPSGSADTGIDVGKVLSKQDIEMSIAFGNDPKKIAKVVRESQQKSKR